MSTVYQPLEEISYLASYDGAKHYYERCTVRTESGCRKCADFKQDLRAFLRRIQS